MRVIAAKLSPSPLSCISEEEFLPVTFYTGDKMIPAIMNEVGRALRSVRMYFYCCDYTELFFKLVTLISAGVQGHFILYKAIF